jgi:hypothetical protein
MAVARMADGPCAGRHEQVARGREAWLRVGRPGRVGVETQMWACYEPAAGGEYVYSGLTITTQQLADALRAAQADGHTHGETYGV